MWFDLGTANLIGAILGSSIGILGGAWGAMAGVFARQGKHRQLILSFAVGLVVVGIASLGVALAALFMRQPITVYWPFLLVGLVLTVSILPNYFVAKKAYRNAELRKIAVDGME